MALRKVVKNLTDWTNANVKTEIARWIHDICQFHPQGYSITPSGETVLQRRRAASCEPASDVAPLKHSVSTTSRSRHCTPQGKSRPTFPHSETAPVSRDKRMAKFSVPKIQLNGSTKADDGGVDDSSDEGYASIHRDRWHRSEDDDEESLSSFIVKDKSFDDDSNASYVEKESVENEEYDEDSAGSSEDLSRREESDEDYDLSYSEGHCHLPDRQSRIFSSTELYCTPTKAHNSIKPPKSRAKEDRRRSWRV